MNRRILYVSITFHKEDKKPIMSDRTDEHNLENITAPLDNVKRWDIAAYAI